jgi:hypothetical protein
VITAQVGVRTTLASGAMTAAIDANDVVAVLAGEPAPDTLRVAARAVQRALDADPALVGPGLPVRTCWRVAEAAAGRGSRLPRTGR